MRSGFDVIAVRNHDRVGASATASGRSVSTENRCFVGSTFARLKTGGDTMGSKGYDGRTFKLPGFKHLSAEYLKNKIRKGLKSTEFKGRHLHVARFEKTVLGAASAYQSECRKCVVGVLEGAGYNVKNNGWAYPASKVINKTVKRQLDKASAPKRQLDKALEHVARSYANIHRGAGRKAIPERKSIGELAAECGVCASTIRKALRIYERSLPLARTIPIIDAVSFTRRAIEELSNYGLMETISPIELDIQIARILTFRFDQREKAITEMLEGASRGYSKLVGRYSSHSEKQ